MKRWIEGIVAAAALGASEPVLAKELGLKSAPNVEAIHPQSTIADSKDTTRLVPLTEPPPDGEPGNWLALDPAYEPRPEWLESEKNIQVVQDYIRNREAEIEGLKRELAEMQGLTESESLQWQMRHHRQQIKKLSHKLARARLQLTKLEKALAQDLHIKK